LIFHHQDPAPSPAAFLITAYNSPINQSALGRLQRTAGRLKHTPVLGSDTTVSRIGKENNLHAISTSKKTKAPSVPLSTSESPNKKQKQVLL